MKIILLGYMGSGKSGIGKDLATQIQLPFLDLDEEICSKEGRDISEIFGNSGEIYFRKRESATLSDILTSGPKEFVLALGGGTPCYGKNLQLLKDTPDTVLIYLRTSLQELTRRLLSEKDQRPLLNHLNSEEVLNDFIRKHLFERTYYYNQSGLIVDTDGKTTLEVAGEIGKLLE